MDQKPIVKVCAAAGGISRLARLLGVTSPTVSQWVSGRRQVPAERCPEIEKAAGGLVRCEDLRPDVDWAYLRATDCPTPQPPAPDIRASAPAERCAAPQPRALACATAQAAQKQAA